MCRLSSFLLVIGYLGILVFSPMEIYAQPRAPLTDVKRVRDLLNTDEFREERKELIRMGEKGFPAFQAVLLDPKESLEVARIFYIVREIKGDRRRFLEHAVRGLMHSNASVRASAVQLLGEIGTVTEASPVVALLSDGEISVVHFAAKTLVAIGGPREVIAMDVWLLGASQRYSDKMRQHVKQCRDELQKKLDKVSPKKPN